MTILTRPWRRVVDVTDAPGPGGADRESDGVVLAAHAVSVMLGGNPVLVDVNLDVHVGELVALIGPNGAGKSTLLGALAGDQKVDAGRVTIDGDPVAGLGAVALARRRGVLLQDVTLSFPFTVLQVVRMGRTPWANTAAEDLDDDVVLRVMEETDVLHLAERHFTSLSGGERARVALARVLAQAPGVLLLDEPTAALDIRHQEQVLTITRERAARGDAVVVVMHDLGLAAAHADRVAVVAGGRIHAVGPPGAVLTAAILSEVYEHPIELIDHPRTGRPLIVPWRP